MNKKKKEILIAIFLGYLGGYRFYKKQYLLGVIYFLTLGLFFIGWLVDIILACKPNTNKSEYINRTVITEFYTKVVGVTYPCVQGGCYTRQEALENLRYKDKLLLEYFDYEGTPAYRVYNKRNYSDIGNLKADLSNEIYNKYKDCKLDITDFEITGGDSQNYGCNIKVCVSKVS